MDDLRTHRQELYQEALGDVVKTRVAADDTAALAARAALDLYRVYRELGIEPHTAEEGRPRWETMLSGLRLILARLQDSLLLRFALPALGLEALVPLVSVYAQRLGVFQRHAYRLKETEARYAQALARGMALQEARGEDRPALLRTYCALSTWESPAALDAFAAELNDYYGVRTEIIIEGPIQMVLQLNEDAIFALIRLPIWRRLGDGIEMRDLQSTALYLRGILAKQMEAGVLGEAVAVLQEANEKTAEKLIKEEREAWSLVKDKEGRDKFLSLFAAGNL